tara:strand:- start:136 stop:435 length:300 start_codon:yes stop_codon:yes gene_type:complete
MGGQTLTYTTVQTGVAAWVQTVFGMERQEFDQMQVKVSHKVYFNQNPDIGEDLNRIIWTDANSEKHVLEFRSEWDASVGLGKLHRVNCEEMSNRPTEDQ